MVVEENPAISRNRHRIFGEYLSRKIPEAAGWFLAILEPDMEVHTFDPNTGRKGHVYLSEF